MSILVETNIDFEAVECASCGTIFGISSAYQRNRREDHRGFSCPNGHINVYNQDNEAERLRKRLKEEQGSHANTQLELIATKNKIKSLQKRIANGVCPCCHRQFVNVARHMKTKHPEMVAENA